MNVRVITLECTPEQQMKHIERAIEDRLDELSSSGTTSIEDEEYAAMFNFLCDLGAIGYEQ